MKLKIGHIRYIKNKLRWWSAAKNYHFAWIQLSHLSRPTPIMLTDRELERAIKRARKNPEDVIKYEQ